MPFLIRIWHLDPINPRRFTALCCGKVQRRANGSIVADLAQKDKFFKLIA